MTSLRPLEIIGGGLAGLSLGLALRRADIPVTLLEAGSYPRHRVCGEFITGLAPATITRLGLAPFLATALSHRDIAWFSPDQLVRRQRLPATALALSRHTLDAHLAETFVAAGGDLRTHTRLTDPTPVEGRVFTTGRRREQSGWLGLKIHARHFALACDLEIHLGHEAYVGVTRIAPNEVNLCGLFRQRPLAAPGAALLLAYLQATGLTALAARLTAAERDDASFSAVAGLGFAPAAPTPDRLALGDAWALIPPFTGNGMAMAFQSAECALDPLLAYARHECDWPTTIATAQRALTRRFHLRLTAAGRLHSCLLQPARQRWLTRLARARLLPLRPLYAVMH